MKVLRLSTSYIKERVTQVDNQLHQSLQDLSEISQMLVRVRLP